ncbi:MAG: polyhydroxyalkanoic acid system family protein [Burkholderiales bacterium]
MADLNITRAHSMPVKKAREAAEGFARQLDEKFDLESEWQGDTLHFRRAGVAGTLALSKNSVAINVKLGLLLSAFRGKFEEHINANLDRVFGAPAPAKAPRKKA